MGDVGGLFDILSLIGNQLISPFSNHALYSLLSTLLIRVVPSTQKNLPKSKKKSNDEQRKADFFEKYGCKDDPRKTKLLANIIKD